MRFGADGNGPLGRANGLPRSANEPSQGHTGRRPVNLTLGFALHTESHPTPGGTAGFRLGEALRVFLRNDHGLELAGGGAARSFGRAVAAPPGGRGSRPGSRPDGRPAGRIDALRGAAERIDWVPDLGAQIGSRDWWRGLATLAALCAATWILSPALDRPLTGAVPAPLAGSDWDEARAQGIAPLAWGADTGRRMAANDLVVPLAEAPERPIVELTATFGQGDTLGGVLQRAGVGRGDMQAASDLVAAATPLADIRPGTRFALTLGRRADRTSPRPLERLDFRARFDLALSLTRAATGLTLQRRPIAIDTTPLRIEGLVGASLYRSARAAGAPARVVEAYIKALATRLSIGSDIAAADTFDLIIARSRAATGETELGDLLFAGIDQGSSKTQLVRFSADDGDQGDGSGWFDANGQTQRRGFMGMPVAGHITSNFGMRFHPILGFSRMHEGIDIGAPYGSPIYAVLDGIVQSAGWTGGYGNLVALQHAGGISSRYGHMSRVAVAPGTRVRQGQVIGYIGSTGLSTGPHVHWEIRRGGVPVNPLSFSFSSVAQLSGDKLRAFRAKVAGLLAVKPGG